MFQSYVTPVYAGFWYRVLAYIIDSLLAACIFFPLGIVLGVIIVATGEEPNSGPVIFARVGEQGISMLVTWLYFALCESSTWQGTVGKKLLGLRVTDLDGNRISFGQATGRHFGKILSGLILCIGFLMVAFTDQKQGLHDQIAGTLVLRGPAIPNYPEPPPPPDFSYRASEFS